MAANICNNQKPTSEPVKLANSWLLYSRLFCYYYVCVGTHVFVGAYVHMCKWKPEGSFLKLPTFFICFCFSFRLTLSLTWNSQHRVSWLASEAKGLTYPASPALTLHVHIPMLGFFFLSRFWGSNLKVLILEAFCWLRQFHSSIYAILELLYIKWMIIRPYIS